MSKGKKIILAIIALLIGVFLILFFFGWMIERQKMVAEGLASPKFPYLKYSQEELAQNFPEFKGLTVPTTQTPEQTHALFIANLKKGDINSAVECCFRKGDWDKQKQFIQGVKDKGLYEVMVSDLSVIEKDPQMYFDAEATYLYSGTKGNNKVGRVMEFIKDSSGKWLIKDF